MTSISVRAAAVNASTVFVVALVTATRCQIAVVVVETVAFIAPSFFSVETVAFRRTVVCHCFCDGAFSSNDRGDRCGRRRFGNKAGGLVPLASQVRERPVPDRCREPPTVSGELCPMRLRDQVNPEDVVGHAKRI